MKKGETVLKERVLKRLKNIPNVWAEKIQQVAIVGTPDLLLCVAGRFVAIELKASGGRVSGIQLHKLEKIRMAGGAAYVLTPENEDQVIRAIYKMAKEPNYDQTDIQTTQ